MGKYIGPYRSADHFCEAVDRIHRVFDGSDKVIHHSGVHRLDPICWVYDPERHAKQAAKTGLADIA